MGESARAIPGFYIHTESSEYPALGHSSLQTLEARPQFFSKAGLPPQTKEPRLQFYQRWIDAVVSYYFPHPTLLLAFELTLTVLKSPRSTSFGGGWIWLTGSSGLHRNSPQVLNISSIMILITSEIRKSQSPFAPIPSERSAQGQVFQYNLRHQGCSSAERQVFHR